MEEARTLRITGYAVKKDGQYLLGFRYLGPGQTETVWSKELRNETWLSQYMSDAKRMAARVDADGIDKVTLNIKV